MYMFILYKDIIGRPWRRHRVIPTCEVSC